MSLREYYLSELSYLREQGREFSQAHPEAAPYLGESGSDPDVERLFEGFAFLTGRLRQRLDDEEPALTKGLLDLFMPPFLRPFPSVSLQQFDYAAGAVAEPVQVERGTEVTGVAGDGATCRFATTAAIELVPLRIYDVQVDRGERPCLHLGIEVTDGLSFADVVAQRARLHFVGDPLSAQCWRLCFLHLCRGLVVSGGGGGVTKRLPASSVQAAGFGDEEVIGVDDGTTFQGYEHLLEYWHCPDKFNAVDLTDLSAFRALGDARRARLTIELTRLPAPMPTLGANECQFNCVPAVNCYEHSAVPVTIDPFQTRYRVRPDGDGLRVYSLQRVSARLKDGSGERVFHPMYHRLRGGEAAYAYHALPEADGRDWSLRLAGADMATLVDGIDVISIDLLVTDGERPLDLGLGEIRDVSGDAAAKVMTKNLQRPSRPAEPPRGDDAYWRLLGRLALNYRSIQSPEDLRQMLRVHHFAALTERDAERRLALVLEGLRAVTIKQGRRLVRGALVPGIEIQVDIDEELIGGDGPLHLLGSVLSSLFAHSVTINAFSRVQVLGLRSRELFSWPVHVGRRSIA